MALLQEFDTALSAGDASRRFGWLSGYERSAGAHASVLAYLEELRADLRRAGESDDDAVVLGR